MNNKFNHNKNRKCDSNNQTDRKYVASTAFIGYELLLLRGSLNPFPCIHQSIQFFFANLKRIRSFSNVELIWLTLTGHMRLSLRMITCVKLKSLRAKQFGCFFTIRSTNRTQIECEARDYGPKCDGIQLRQKHDLC